MKAAVNLSTPVNIKIAHGDLPMLERYDVIVYIIVNHKELYI